MNKQQYANKFSLEEWKLLCKSQDFVEAFWKDDFTRADEIVRFEMGL